MTYCAAIATARVFVSVVNPLSVAWVAYLTYTRHWRPQGLITQATLAVLFIAAVFEPSDPIAYGFDGLGALAFLAYVAWSAHESRRTVRVFVHNLDLSRRQQ